jgi:type III pantothenate kinase
MSDVSKTEVTSVILASVVPPLTPVFQELSQRLFSRRPLTIGPGLKTGMPVLYENPLEVGADRIVLAVAAFDKYRGPSIVVDFGTATTFDAISEKGEYMGGAIAPGMQIAAEALYLKTAKLPRIEIRKPKRAVGRTTESSMQAGLYYGYVGLVASIIDRFKQEMGEGTTVVATGGFASLLTREVDSIDFHEPDLILEGLRIIHDKNKE